MALSVYLPKAHEAARDKYYSAFEKACQERDAAGDKAQTQRQKRVTKLYKAMHNGTWLWIAHNESPLRFVSADWASSPAEFESFMLNRNRKISKTKARAFIEALREGRAKHLTLPDASPRSREVLDALVAMLEKSIKTNDPVVWSW